VRERLAVRGQRGRPAGRDQDVLGDDVGGPGGLGVVDDVGRVGTRLEQRLEDRGVQPAARRDRNARDDRVARELDDVVNAAVWPTSQ